MSSNPRRPTLRPSHIALGLGVAFAVIVAVSGIVPVIVGEHEPEGIGRADFFNVPRPLYVIFYTVVACLWIAVGYLFAQRVENWERGTPDRREVSPKRIRRRLHDYRAGVLMQTLFRDGAAGLMHSLIYFPFMVLFAVTVVLETNHQMPESLKVQHRGV